MPAIRQMFREKHFAEHGWYAPNYNPGVSVNTLKGLNAANRQQGTGALKKKAYKMGQRPKKRYR